MEGRGSIMGRMRFLWINMVDVLFSFCNYVARWINHGHNMMAKILNNIQHTILQVQSLYFFQYTFDKKF